MVRRIGADYDRDVRTATITVHAMAFRDALVKHDLKMVSGFQRACPELTRDRQVLAMMGHLRIAEAEKRPLQLPELQKIDRVVTRILRGASRDTLQKLSHMISEARSAQAASSDSAELITRAAERATRDDVLESERKKQ